MTPTEVFIEIRKMPLGARQRVHDELHDELAQTELSGLNPNERGLIESMLKKGHITRVPNRMKGPIQERKIQRVNVIGKPISETIIEDRG